ncbi:MAG TPA: hypothetical protein VNN73_04515 [Blastocatellia bacterium]|nr:hypothetical protein [Blastocatellia bacterium]
MVSSASNHRAEYLKQIEKALQAGNATEHTHRPALKSLIESLGDGITATNEPKCVKCGAPDFIITRGETPLGYIEAKDVNEPLDRIERGAQMARYLESLGNLILTDYLEFRQNLPRLQRGGVAPINPDVSHLATFLRPLARPKKNLELRSVPE